MVVHFICMGNVYRSRLAEAYLNSLHLPHVKATSSGVYANMNLWGPIGSYTVPLLEDDGILNLTAPKWTQVSQAVIDQADVVICVNREVYSRVKAEFTLPLRTFIWDITDINKLLPQWQYHEAEVVAVTQRTYRHIKQRVDELAWLLTKPRSKSLLDIYAPDGRKLGIKADIDTVHQKGLWHRGVHAALYTRDGGLLLQKRSQSIIGNPGLWDFSMGGLSESGETGDQTLRRELKEELGLSLAKAEFLTTWRYNHYLSRYGLHSRALVDTYLVEIPTGVKLTIQPSEVAEAKVLPIKEATEFILAGHSHLGQTVPAHAFYRHLLRAIDQRLGVAV